MKLLKRWLICCLALCPVWSQAQTPYRVIISKLNVRSIASTKSTIVGSLNLNDTISVIKNEKGWAAFIYKGKIRYVSATYLEEIIVHKEEPAEEIIILEEDTVTNIPEPEFEDVPIVHRKKGFCSLFADIYGGYSNYICPDISPNPGLGFGIDVGVSLDYSFLWFKIPQGLFGELSIGYSRRGSSAFPYDGIGARFLPIGYRWSMTSNLALVGKTGIYFTYPFSTFNTLQTQYSAKFDCGISISIGTEWKHFGAMISYEHGFTNVFGGWRTELHNQGAYLTISYKFITFK